jgi:tetratricopeptide (TPR) repeat protein
MFLHQYDQAVASLEKAIAFAPNDPEVYSTFGQVLNYWGNPEKGMQMLEKSFSIDTTVPPNWEYQIGLSNLLLCHYDKALAGFNRAIERAPRFAYPYLLMACAYVELDRLEDARGAIKRALEITPQYSLKKVPKIYPYRIDEVRDRMLYSLRKAGLPEG